MLEVNRRQFLKSSVAASAAATVGIPLTSVQASSVKEAEKDLDNPLVATLDSIHQEDQKYFNDSNA